MSARVPARATGGVDVTRVLLTGMSGTGKSTVVQVLIDRGYRAIDTDYGGFSELVSVADEELTGPGPGQDWVWREDRIQDLLSCETAPILFVSGCSPNQGRFYPQFDHIVLLSAPADVLVQRLTSRTNNPHGQRPGEIERVLSLQRDIEPLLRAGAGLEIDTRVPVDEVVATLLRHVGETG